MEIKLPLTALFAFIILLVQGQNLSNPSVIQQDNEVLVSYQLDSEKGKAWSVSLYASHNNFSSPLKMVQGDVNDKRILPGGSKQIRWNALDEVKNFDGDISFQIKATPAAPLFKNIEASSTKVKRGKEVTISWSAVHSKEPVKVELVREENVVPIGTGSNGKLTYTVPKKMKVGEYTIALSSAGEVIQGGSFAVKPKYPLLVKVLPIVAVGIVTIIIINNQNKPDPVPDAPVKLDPPPTLTGN